VGSLADIADLPAPLDVLTCFSSDIWGNDVGRYTERWIGPAYFGRRQPQPTDRRWRLVRWSRCLRRSSLDGAMPFKSL